MNHKQVASFLDLYGMDRQHDEERMPESALKQLRQLCELLRESLPPLSGVILHGSAASSGFEPERSDLDVLVIVDRDLLAGEIAEVAEGVLTISGAPHPLEISIVSYSDLQNWHHPCPHLFHFGEEQRVRFATGQFTPLSPHDEDLTMHLTVAKTRGIDLLGSFPLSGLPDVPRVDYLTAILSDLEWAAGQEEDLADYMFSNACRTMAFLRESLVLSKLEGRYWCRDNNIDISTIFSDVVDELRREVVISSGAGREQTLGS